MDLLQTIPLTINLSNAGAVAGTTNTFTTTATTSCAIKGKFATTLGALTNSATTPTTDLNTGATFVTIPPNYAAAVVFGTNAAGALKGVQGPLTATETGVTTTVGAFAAAPQFPTIPDDFCPIAYTVIRAAPSLTAGFIVGSTSWAASGASCTTFKNICTLPDRPQIA
jgi:hypothetical protein